MFSIFLPCSLPPPQRLQFVKRVENAHKQLKLYSVSLHGLMTLLRKFQGKSAREKSAMVREPLGCQLEEMQLSDLLSIIVLRHVDLSTVAMSGNLQYTQRGIDVDVTIWI